jgi:hypothetical protein
VAALAIEAEHVWLLAGLARAAGGASEFLEAGRTSLDQIIDAITDLVQRIIMML